ncbi:MAG: 50S ribosomal protein L21 [Phycisphaerae bacterium]|nr:50S ribosomal protein L21 [Phycisphaerae bacterium]
MYAIIEDGSRQYRVSVGDTIEVDRRDLAEGQEAMAFERVLLVGQGADVKIGQPFVDGASVTAKVHGEVKAPKIDVVKFKRRKGYHVKQGHRQRYLRVTVTDITS